MSWKLIDKLIDDEKVYSGALVRFYNNDKAISETARLLVEPMDYIIVCIMGLKPSPFRRNL